MLSYEHNPLYIYQKFIYFQTKFGVEQLPFGTGIFIKLLKCSMRFSFDDNTEKCECDSSMQWKITINNKLQH